MSHQSRRGWSNGRGDYSRHNTGYTPYRNSGASTFGQSTEQSPQRTFAGHKRKLDALRDPGPQSHPKREVAPPTAPSVPSFSTFSLPGKPATLKSHSKGSALSRQAHEPRDGRSEVKKSKSLGLVPKDDALQYSTSESDDEVQNDDDEEASLLAKLPNNLTFFDHNGTKISIETEADILAWKNERRHKFPSKARISIKDQARCEEGERRLALINQARIALYSGQRVASKKQHEESRRLGAALKANSAPSLEGPHHPATYGKIKVVEDTEDIDDQAEMVERLMPSDDNRSGQQMQDAPTLHHTDGEMNEDDAPQVPPKSANVDPSLDTISDDDGPPEETSSRIAQPLPEVNEARSQQPSIDRNLQHHGQRRNSQSSRTFDKVRSAPHRATIFEALRKLESTEKNQLALQAIKALGQKGFFAETLCK